MTERLSIALDTNIVVYASRFNDAARAARCNEVIDGLVEHDIVLAAQVLGELFTAAIRKGGLERRQAADFVQDWAARFDVTAASVDTFDAALDLASTHQLQFWDALILATAAEAGCRLLLSEDMRDGFVWRGCTVADPMAERLHPLLADALTSRRDAPPR